MQQDYPMTAQGAVLTDSRHKVLRNTYLMLALTLVPTAIGAVIGVNLNFGFLRANPIIASIAMLAIFYGWIFAIERNKDSALGVGLLLGFTLFMGLLLGPILQVALGLSNGGQLVGLAAGGTAATFFGLAAVATHHQARLQLPRQLPDGGRDRVDAGSGGQHLPRQPAPASGAVRCVHPDQLDADPVSAERDRERWRDQLRLRDA